MTSKLPDVTMPSRKWIRRAVALVLLTSALVLASGYLTKAPDYPSEGSVVGDPVDPRPGITVTTTQKHGELVAFAPNGSTLYYNNSAGTYWDVDPSPLGETTVVYSAARSLSKEECPASGNCRRVFIERANLSTGEVDRLYSMYVPGQKANRWHDVDRIDDHRFVVAGIDRNRVSVLNATTGHVEWQWEAQQAFPIGGGGSWPNDWAHVNDVEVLPDGRIMVSLRNQDQVVFLRQNGTVDEDWTLGADDDHDVLYEQHNPDYIPESRGGPAVVVADSENNRLVEYQRRAGEWVQTWVWRDETMDWPRDADRLPNGNTLVADSLAHRVVEINADGDVVWSFRIANPYEVERLGTGDESAGGPAATAAQLQSRTPGGDETTSVSVGYRLKQLVPSRLLHGLQHVTPVWMGVFEFLAGALFAVTVLVWFGCEWYWSSLTLRRPVVRQ